MILLPRGNPVKEKVNPGKVNLPEALDKLRQGKFTGYLRFNFPTGTGVFLFEGGCFVDALFESAHDSLLTQQAITRVFSESLKLQGSLSIYRLSAELALLLHGVLHSELLHQGQELELLNVRALLKRLRDERLDGCLRVYGGQQVALIFYRGGQPLGFFHDGAVEVERTADVARSVAREAGARIDVLEAPAPSGKPLADLWEAVNLAELWQAALGEQSVAAALAAPTVKSGPPVSGEERQALLLGVVRKVAQKYLGAFGASLAEKEFATLVEGPLDQERLTNFFARLAQAAELVIETDKVQEMLVEMKQGVRPLLTTK